MSLIVLRGGTATAWDRLAKWLLVTFAAKLTNAVIQYRGCKREPSIFPASAQSQHWRG